MGEIKLRVLSVAIKKLKTLITFFFLAWKLNEISTQYSFAYYLFPEFCYVEKSKKNVFYSILSLKLIAIKIEWIMH